MFFHDEGNNDDADSITATFIHMTVVFLLNLRGLRDELLYINSIYVVVVVQSLFHKRVFISFGSYLGELEFVAPFP